MHLRALNARAGFARTAVASSSNLTRSQILSILSVSHLPLPGSFKARPTAFPLPSYTAANTHSWNKAHHPAAMATENRTTTTPSGLPEEVVTCLQNARFLHLATCSNNVPHVSLMNYTYLPSTPYSQSPTIIMTTPPTSRKTLNLESNPLVSLLVHDWISHRPPTLSQPARSPSPTHPAPRSGSLAELLLGINTASLSRISTTINGTAELVPSGSAEESWYKAQHLANNTFGSSGEDSYASSPAGGGLWGGGGLILESDRNREAGEGDGGTKCYVEGKEVRVVVVSIRDGRIADWQGQVRDWRLIEDHSTASNGVST
ncbi:hypothetical protein HBH98_025840 [Parastagonospora nodorum]|nr:hypothetical protein HBH52_035970 [Parastagonospora nodorum]KAH4001260.1 hypothetical protein HBI10_095650 [Parastagonospora nodorum]KAH4033400.1 hypothetical protein HBI13_010110 [Parastagonospora nodorum]KAH4060626.1 hypothetical protein HBH49_004580 [Parastagonospora nodorum]KAH4111495.1 hypothetical protein HBH46_009730 [Parastagonospora nodorum]